MQDGFHEASQLKIKFRENIFAELLGYFDTNEEAFLFHIVVADKTWVHLEPETKWQSLEWQYSHSSFLEGEN